jgi:hypothetical protein
MIDRGTFGCEKEFSVLSFIYDYFDRTDKDYQKKITKVILKINRTVLLLNSIEDPKFRADTAILYKQDIQSDIYNFFTDIDIRDRLLNFNKAKLSNVINKAKFKAYTIKEENKKQQRLSDKNNIM